METTEYYDSNNGIPSKHLPIPHGGAKLLIMIILAAMTSVFLETRVGIPRFTSEVVALLAFGLLWPVIFGQNIGHWLRNYWNRNVVGRQAEFSKLTDSTSQYKIKATISTGRLKPSVSDGYREPRTCTLPLGGWFKRHMFIKGEYRRYWKARTHSKTSDWDQLHVQIRDREGDHVKLSIETALDLLEIFGANDFSWENFISTMIRQRARYQTEYGQAKLRFNIILETVKNIDATSRFVHSEQGKDIRKWLVEATLKTFDEHDPRRRELQQLVDKRGTTVS
jgi:hypothetical protein